MAKRKPTTKKYEIARRSEINPENLLPVIQNLSAYGLTTADIGIMLGYSGKDPEGWIRRLTEKYPDVKEALQAGKNLGDIELIKTAMQESLGYWIEEEEVYEQNKPTVKPISPTESKTVDRFIPISRKVKRKFIPPNTALLFKLLCCRMPEYFSDTKKVEINKRSIELKGQTEKEIKEFAGKLLDIIDVEFETKETENALV